MREQELYQESHNGEGQAGIGDHNADGYLQHIGLHLGNGGTEITFCDEFRASAVEHSDNRFGLGLGEPGVLEGFHGLMGVEGECSHVSDRTIRCFSEQGR